MDQPMIFGGNTIAGAGDVGQQSIGHATSGFDIRRSGTERGRYNTDGLYTGPRIVVRKQQSKDRSDEFDPEDQSVHYIGNQRL